MSSNRATIGVGVKGLSVASLDTGADGRNPLYSIPFLCDRD